MEFATLRSLPPVMQRLAGIEYPWHGIFEGEERLCVIASACLVVLYGVVIRLEIVVCF